MPSELEDAVESFYDKVAAGDRATSTKLLNTFEDITADLMQEITKFEQDMLAKYGPNGAMSASDVLRQARYQSIMAQYRAATDVYYKHAAGIIGDATNEAVELAVRQAKEFAELSGFSSSFGFDAAPIGAIRSLTAALNNGPLADLTNGLGPYEAVDSMHRAMLSGMAAGHGPEQIAQEMNKQAHVPLGKAELIARTETMRAMRSSINMTYEANSDILSGWMWNAAKSERSCAACLALDGRVFPLGTQMNSHPRCRCVQTPVLSDPD